MAEVAQKTNGKAIASLVLGVFALIGPYLGIIAAIIGIFLAVTSRKEIAASGENGEGIAMAGLICNIIAIVYQSIIIILAILGFALFGIL